MNVVHIPKLAEYGLIDWDSEERIVTRGPHFDEARPLLDQVPTETDTLQALSHD